MMPRRTPPWHAMSRAPRSHISLISMSVARASTATWNDLPAELQARVLDLTSRPADHRLVCKDWARQPVVAAHVCRSKTAVTLFRCMIGRQRKQPWLDFSKLTSLDVSTQSYHADGWFEEALRKLPNLEELVLGALYWGTCQNRRKVRCAHWNTGCPGCAMSGGLSCVLVRSGCPGCPSPHQGPVGRGPTPPQETGTGILLLPRPRVGQWSGGARPAGHPEQAGRADSHPQARHHTNADSSVAGSALARPEMHQCASLGAHQAARRPWSGTHAVHNHTVGPGGVRGQCHSGVHVETGSCSQSIDTAAWHASTCCLYVITTRQIRIPCVT